MKRQSILYPLIVSSTVVGVGFGAGQSFADQFIGSPLLILAVAIAVDAVAFLYRRIRR